MTKPLHGFTVVELAVTVAGPAAAGILCDWGATVIKVEPPDGDPQRYVMGTMAGVSSGSPGFDNRGKKSIVLDLKVKDHLEIMHKLLSTADVFVTNYRQSALVQYKLDSESLHVTYPRLVVAPITGYGRTGPDADRHAYDVGAFWARSSLARSMQVPNEYPTALAAGLGDHFTAMSLVAGINCALLSREKTGKGQIVETSLLRAGAYANGWYITQAMQYGKQVGTQHRSAAPNPLLNVYKSKDSKYFWLLGLDGDRHFPPTAKAVGCARLLEDERFKTPKDRRKNSKELIKEFDAAFASMTLEELSQAFSREGTWWGPVQDSIELYKDAQAHAAGVFVQTPDNPKNPQKPGSDLARETFRLSTATPVTFGQASVAPSAPVPTVGEHTEEIVKSLGFPVDKAKPRARKADKPHKSVSSKL